MERNTSPLLVKRNRASFSGFGALCLLLLTSLASPAFGAGKSSPLPQYLVVPLGTLDNPASSAVVRRVNSLGEVVGGYKSSKLKQSAAAFLLTQASGFDEITDLQTTDFSATYGINDFGEVAGLINEGSNVRPFRAVRHTGFQLLTLLDGDTNGAAYGINDQGEAVGFSGGPSGTHAAWWTRKGDVTPLPLLPGYTTAKGIDINHKGDIVGFAGEDSKVAVLWPSKGAPVLLQSLPNFTNTQADSISDRGDVVGSAQGYDPANVRVRALLWTAGSTTAQDLGTLPGGSRARARDVDNTGMVVGTSESGTMGNRAFFWTASTGMQDLNTVSLDSSYVLLDAMSINKNGAILAIAVRKSDYPRHDISCVDEHELPKQIVLLTPVLP